jgi:Ras-related protein Rab-1A
MITNNIFSELHNKTFYPDFSAKIINLEKKLFLLQIWDTTGDERLRSTNQSYYKGAYGIIIVYDVTDKKSFENITHYYLKEIEKNANQDVIKVLVGNKCDKSGRVVTEEEGKQLAENYNMSFFEVSAKCSGCVNNIFVHITKEIFYKKALLFHLADNAKIKVSLSTKESPEISDDLNKILSLLGKNYNDMKATEEPDLNIKRIDNIHKCLNL